MSGKKFKRLALGGTFDTFHKGHEKTLAQAFSLSEKVLIGLTSDSLAGKIGKTHQINPYEKRKEALEKFLQRKKLAGRVEIIQINQRYGVTHKLADLDAIMVSRETLPIALEINKIREKNRLKPLEIVILNKLETENGRPISSTRIRADEIDRNGHILKKQPVRKVIRWR